MAGALQGQRNAKKSYEMYGGKLHADKVQGWLLRLLIEYKLFD